MDLMDLLDEWILHAFRIGCYLTYPRMNITCFAARCRGRMPNRADIKMVTETPFKRNAPTQTHTHTHDRTQSSTVGGRLYYSIYFNKLSSMYPTRNSQFSVVNKHTSFFSVPKS